MSFTGATYRSRNDSEMTASSKPSPAWVTPCGYLQALVDRLESVYSSKLNLPQSPQQAILLT